MIAGLTTCLQVVKRLALYQVLERGSTFSLGTPVPLRLLLQFIPQQLTDTLHRRAQLSQAQAIKISVFPAVPLGMSEYRSSLQYRAGAPLLRRPTALACLYYSRISPLQSGFEK